MREIGNNFRVNTGLNLTPQKTLKENTQLDSFTPGVNNQTEVSTMNPEVMMQKNRLAELGVNFSDPGKLLTEQETISLLKGFEAFMKKIPEAKRPKNLPITLEAKDPNGTAAGKYSPMLKEMTIYRFSSKDKPYTLERLILTTIHEYGHATHDALKPDVEGELPYPPMLDSKGKDITERAVALEKDVKAKGYNPDDIADDVTLFDKYDPYIDSHKWKNKEVIEEKYCRKNFKEHFAETFREYIAYPEKFRGKISDMEKEMTSQKPGSEEYNYLKESLDIMKESYNYFKTEIFDGSEFQTTTKFRDLNLEITDYDEE